VFVFPCQVFGSGLGSVFQSMHLTVRKGRQNMPQALLDAIAAVIGLLNSHVPAAGLQRAIDAVSRVLGV
jgi:predicted ABC-type sugar transport system permease subunit